MSHQGKCVIFSAPSGSGKTTIVKHLLNSREDLGFSISACTRLPRKNVEKSGQDYYFLSLEEFKDKIDHNAFVEWEEVYQGCFYGTLKEEVQRLWDLGKAVVFDVDVKGGIKLKEYFGESALSIFVKVPSMEVLEKRLRDRGTDSEDSIKTRLYKVEFEMQFENQFDITLVNDNLEDSFTKADHLISDFISK